MQGFSGTRSRGIFLRHSGLLRRSSRMASQAGCAAALARRLGPHHRSSTLHLYEQSRSALDVPYRRNYLGGTATTCTGRKSLLHGVLELQVSARSHREPCAAEDSRTAETYASRTTLRVRRPIQQSNATMAKRTAGAQTDKDTDGVCALDAEQHKRLCQRSRRQPRNST